MATMKRPDSQLEEPSLFDLPLHAPAPSDPKKSPAQRPRAAEAPQPQALSLFPDGGCVVEPEAEPEPPLAERLVAQRAGPRPVPPPGPSVPTAGLAPRLAAGLADLAVHAGIAVLLVSGSRALGVSGAPPWPPLVLCLALFSFLYFVVPLAFWGKTPGMAWRGLQARARNGQPLSFGQAARRWLGAIVTVLLAGLPALAALADRSLTDLLSGSVVRRDG